MLLTFFGACVGALCVVSSAKVLHAGFSHGHVLDELVPEYFRIASEMASAAITNGLQTPVQGELMRAINPLGVSHQAGLESQDRSQGIGEAG